MPIDRVFLDWRQPGLAAAAEFLRGRFVRGTDFNLGAATVVVPGARAGRRLLELLVELAEEHALVLTPPEIVTADRLPERLYRPKLQFADALTQQLAWVQALRSSPPERIAPFLPYPPPGDDLSRWAAVAETLCKLHTELAADGLNCEQVLQGAAAVENFAEHDRWQTLCQIQSRYLATLDDLQLWDVQTARLVAIEKREIAADGPVMLLGMVDLNRAQRQMLDQIADRVTALVVAPPELAERFDEHGCLVPNAWTEVELPLDDAQIERVGGPADQAEAVVEWLAALGSRYAVDQVAIGLPDARLAPQIERQLAQSGLATRQAIARPVAETAPYRLLKIAADYAARQRFDRLAALSRHPDVSDWLAARWSAAGGAADFLTALDDYARDHVPARLDEERLAHCDRPEVAAVYRRLTELVAPLLAPPQTLAEWAERLRQVLLAVYGERQLNRDDPADRLVLESLEKLRGALDAGSKVPTALQPTLDVRQACRILLDGLAGEGIAPPAAPGAIELLGWLELPLDDAPALIVTTFNEGWVPSATTADAFLPNRLREALGLLHNDRRLARDAYALAALLASREELKLLVGQRDAEGNPLTPSRLLFATAPDLVVARARRFFDELPPTPPRRNPLTPARGPLASSRLAPPLPERLAKPLPPLSVTQFRDYIACPYRFYLRHVLQLEAISDQAAELDGGAFGGLVHFVLEQFGRAEEADDVRRATEPKRILEYLEFQLDRISAARYGGQHTRAAVRVQIEQVRLRLRAFAEWQAARSRDGWRIVFSEDSEQPQRTLTGSFAVGEATYSLRGRIDRIDYHDGQRRLAVLDYKTADAGDKPERTHRRGEEWIDLQLPLYRHLVRAAKLEAECAAATQIDLGYVLLPRDVTQTGLALAEWDVPLLKSADAKAAEILEAIRAEQFWPPTLPPPEFAEDVAVLCQDHRLGSYRAPATGDVA